MLTHQIVEFQLFNHCGINILFSCYFHTIYKIKNKKEGKTKKKKTKKKYVFVCNAYARE